LAPRTVGLTTPGKTYPDSRAKNHIPKTLEGRSKTSGPCAKPNDEMLVMVGPQGGCQMPAEQALESRETRTEQKKSPGKSNKHFRELHKKKKKKGDGRLQCTAAQKLKEVGHYHFLGF